MYTASNCNKAMVLTDHIVWERIIQFESMEGKDYQNYQNKKVNNQQPKLKKHCISRASIIKKGKTLVSVSVPVYM